MKFLYKLLSFFGIIYYDKICDFCGLKQKIRYKRKTPEEQEQYIITLLETGSKKLLFKCKKCNGHWK